MNAEVVETRVTDDDICGTVIRAVAVASDKAPETLTPLFDVIDPNALEALFSPSLNAGRQFDGRLVFSYEGYEVSVFSDGDVSVRSSADSV